jgi:hypothetical protein
VSKSDNPFKTLMMYCNVNLNCDGQKIKCRYGKSLPNAKYNTWHINGKDTGFQVLEFISDLKEKYTSIQVTWKR